MRAGYVTRCEILAGRQEGKVRAAAVSNPKLIYRAVRGDCGGDQGVTMVTDENGTLLTKGDQVCTLLLTVGVVPAADDLLFVMR